jgi:phage shock protein PspC (stress-responsive transcriptional regulator)
MKKDTANKMLFGVCSGIAREINIDVTIIRAAFAILTLMGFGLPLIIYFVLAIIMQEG